MVEFDPFSESFFDDPFPSYRRLRDESPVHYVEEFDAWFISRFQHVWDAAGDERLSASGGMTSNELLLGQKLNSGENLGRMDGALHTALRRELARDFLPRAARALEPMIREQVRTYLDELVPRGEFEVVGEFAMRLTVHVACRLLGVPESDAVFLGERVNAFFARERGTRGQTEAGKSATADLFEYLDAWIQERRRAGEDRDDILGRLMSFEFKGWRFQDADLISMLQLIVTGSTETLPKAFAGAVYQLARHPDQRAEVAADRSLAPHAFWEALRTEMPTQMLGRTVQRGLECAGQHLRPGQKVMFLWACANRDEREFEDPDRFDIHRRAPRILSFGQATHRCIGHNIAQLEGRVLLEELLARIPEYTPDEESAVRIRSEFFRGFSKLPIAFDPR